MEDRITVKVTAQFNLSQDDLIEMENWSKLLNRFVDKDAYTYKQLIQFGLELAVTVPNTIQRLFDISEKFTD